MFVNNILSVMLIFISVTSDIMGSGVYSVPNPEIEVFEKGFRFSIPDDHGIELFAFHGNVNEEMNGIEAGQFSKDILKKCGDRWVFEDKSIRLVKGDKIYFWLFVIRNRLGYRYDDGYYVVKDKSDFRPLECSKPSVQKQPNNGIWIFETPQASPSPHKKPLPNKDKKPEPEELSVCCDLFLNISYRMIDVAEENTKLIEENKILYEIAQKDNDYSRTLRIFGKYPTKYYPTPKEFAQNLIIEKLHLVDVKVTEGRTLPDNGISFKVEKLKDKIKVILAAKKGLEGSNYELSW